jgi:DNA-binding PadR family transcriptional regulator
VTRRRVSNPLALAVLSCLSERPMHPYEISTTLRSRGKEQSIKLNYGSLYSVVESLQKHGLIESRETTRKGRRPERTVYEITDAGAAEFEDLTVARRRRPLVARRSDQWP